MHQQNRTVKNSNAGEYNQLDMPKTVPPFSIMEVNPITVLNAKISILEHNINIVNKDPGYEKESKILTQHYEHQIFKLRQERDRKARNISVFQFVHIRPLDS